MKKAAILIMFITSFLSVFAQIDDEMENYFGFRSTDMKEIDFGEVSDIETYNLAIKNNSPNPISITSINPPEGVFILIKNKEISPRSQSEIILMVNPQIYEKEKINGILIVTVREVREGVVIDKQIFYKIKAIISNPKK